MLADEAYGADAIRDELAETEIEAVMRARRNRTGLRRTMPKNTRSVIERPFQRLENWPRVAASNDDTEASYLGFVAIASVKPWRPSADEAQLHDR